MQPLGFTVKLHTTFEQAIENVTAALKTQGFGVLTEIDVKDTFKKKLDKDFRPYKILGACNPNLSYRALSALPEVGLLLPCNVTVDQCGDGIVEVSLVDPLVMMGMVDHPELQRVAEEAQDRLKKVAEALQA